MMVEKFVITGLILLSPSLVIGLSSLNRHLLVDYSLDEEGKIALGLSLISVLLAVSYWIFGV